MSAQVPFLPAHVPKLFGRCARYSYLRMNAKSQAAKPAAQTADKEAAEPLKGKSEANGADSDGTDMLPKVASLTNGHPVKSAVKSVD